MAYDPRMVDVRLVRPGGASPAWRGRRVAAGRGPAAAPVAMTFDDVVREHQDGVYGTALRILGDRNAALDATNQTFLKAYRAIGSYDPARPIRHWLLRIAINEAISIGRARSRARRREAPAAEAASIADRAPAPDAAALAREERDAVRAAVTALPELYRVVVVLRYFDDLSVEEVAAVTGRSPSAVGVQLFRGRQLLRKALAGPSV